MLWISSDQKGRKGNAGSGTECYGWERIGGAGKVFPIEHKPTSMPEVGIF